MRPEYIGGAIALITAIATIVGGLRVAAIQAAATRKAADLAAAPDFAGTVNANVLAVINSLQQQLDVANKKNDALEVIIEAQRAARRRAEDEKDALADVNRELMRKALAAMPPTPPEETPS